jgi:hypothetical protein
MKRTVLLCLAILGFASDTRAGMVNVTIQYRSESSGHPLVYSVGLHFHGKSPLFYYEGGLLMKPAFSKDPTRLGAGLQFEDRRLRGVVGSYAGYHFHLSPLLRPGIYFGALLAQEEIRHSTDGQDYVRTGYTDYRLAPYFGLSLQAGILSFVFTNLGIGGGLNVPF